MTEEHTRPDRAVLRPYRPAAAALAALSCLQSLGLVALALVSRRVLDSGGLGWCLALGLLAAGIPALGAAAARLSGGAVDRAASALRHAAAEGLLGAGGAGRDRFRSGQLFSRLTQDAYTLCQWRISLLPQLAGQGVRLAAALAALCVVSLPLAAAAAAAGVAALAAGRAYRRAVKERHLRARRADESLTGCAQELLDHMELLQAMDAGTEALRRFDRRQEDWRQARRGLRDLTSAGGAAFSAGLRLVYAALLVWGGWAVRGGTLTFGGLAALAQLLGLFQGPLSGLTGVQSQLAAVRAAEERLDALWALPREPSGPPPDTGGACRAIVFDRVTFRYGAGRPPVLRDFSARLPLDRWVCLTGASGSGKTTLFRLILGLYAPQSGRVYLETAAGEIPCTAATRRLFGYVPQTPALFSGTIRENLLLANPRAEEPALRAALERAGCGFVRDLPEGLDTPLGEGGGGLSAGQRQRLAAARALLAGAEILLLDEVTSALDRETGDRLLADLAEAVPAAVSATHRAPAPEGAAILHLGGPPGAAAQA